VAASDSLTRPERNNSPTGRRILPVFFLLGAVAIIIQSVLLREFLVISFGNELSWGLTFFGWLAGIALGAAAGGWAAGTMSRKTGEQVSHRRFPWSPARLFTCSLVLLALVTPVLIGIVRVVRGAFDIGPGEYLSLWTMLWLNPALTVPVSFLIGFTFPLTSALLAGESRSPDPIAKVYAVEAAGSIVGGALFSFLLVGRVAPFHLAAITGAALLVTPALLSEKRTRRRALLLVLPAAFLAAGILWGGTIERHTLQYRWKTFETGTELVPGGSVDSRYQNITLARRENQYSVFLDGLEAMSFPNPTELATTAHFVMCEAREVRRVLLIGGGLEGWISQMLQHPVERVDYVMLDPKLRGLVLGYLPESDRAALRDPRVHVHYDDGRHFLLAAQDSGSETSTDAALPPLFPREYDLICMDMPGPSSILLNRFYTAEFFELVRRRLAPDGLFVFRLTASPGYFGETRRKSLGSIWKPLGRVFPERLATWGDTSFILASRSPGVFTADGRELLRRHEARGVKSEQFNPLWFEGGSDMLTPANLSKIREELTQGETDSGANTDREPRAYLYSLILWNRIVLGRTTSSLEYLDKVSTPWVLLAAGAALLVWLAVSRRVLRKSLVESATLFSVATTGLATMSLELVLLITFQSLYGYVYVRVGIIVAVFMLGLAVGSLVMKRLVRRRGGLGLGSLITLDAGLALFAGALPGVLWLLGRASAQAYPPWVVEWTVWTCVLVGGILGGAIFPLSASIVLGEGRPTGGAAGSVDAADNVGACIGALLTGVVFVPAIGIASTCLVLALLKVLSAVFLVAGRIKGPNTSLRHA
jgi:spermidine synthase